MRYPILPKITRVEGETAPREIAEMPHPSLYAPRDFDISHTSMVVSPSSRAASTIKTCFGPIVLRLIRHRSCLLERSNVPSRKWPKPEAQQ